MTLGHSSSSAGIIWILYSLRRSLLCSTLCTVEHGICNCKLAARIDLCRLRWNASLMQLTFSSGVHVCPGDFTHNRLPVVPSLPFQDQVLFHVGGWCPHWVLKRRWTTVRAFSSAGYNMYWICSCGVDIITDLTGGHQLVHARKPGMKKNLQSFPFWWHKPHTCMIISFQNIHFYFGYLSSGHPVSVVSDFGMDTHKMLW
jgi:hypothetical protein